MWFLLLGGIGLYNLIHYNAHVLHAFNPKYIFDYFKRNGKQGWVSLGGVVLCITAMFADLGHFNVRAIQEMGNLVKRRDEKPTMMNTFEFIATSQGLNLGILFEKEMGLSKCETRFASKLPAKEMLVKIEEAAMPLGFIVEKNNYKLHPVISRK